MDDNLYILAPAAGWFVAQGLKFIFALGKNGFQYNDLISSGGMPSSHSATVASITTLIGLDQGFSTAIFGLSLTMLMIVAYDARGVRRSVELLNYSVNDLWKTTNKNKKSSDLTMAKGHSTPEVLAGIAVGIVVGFVIFNV